MAIPPKHLLAALAVAGLTAVAPTASAVTVTDQTFEFFGTCADCTLNNQPGPMATLVLAEGYVPGSPITLDDLISFSYVGSNLVDPYTVYPDDPLEQGRHLAYGIGGAVDGTPGPKDFFIDFTDGLRFESSAGGSWFTCAPGGAGFYSGTCTFLQNADFGRGQWNVAVNNPVPEPSVAALLALAAVGATWSTRRRRPSDAPAA